MNSKSLSKSIGNKSNKTQEVPKELSISDIILIEDLAVRKRKIDGIVNRIPQNYNSTELTQIVNDICLNLININCDDVVLKLIFKFKLFDVHDVQFVDNYLDLISEFIIYKPNYCKEIISKILIPTLIGDPKLNSINKIDESELVMFNKVHILLSKLDSCVLNFNVSLVRLLGKMFPFHATSSNHTYICYVYNLLKACEYFKNKQQIAFIIFDKLLWIDSKERSLKNQEHQEIFEFEDGEKSENAKVYPLIDLLDHSINQILLFIDNINNERGQFDEEKAMKFMKLFGIAFIKLILSSKFCSHLQFIMLYFCSKSELLCKEFLNDLWEKTLNSELDLEIRQKSVYYIGGLMTKAKYVPIEHIVNFMEIATRCIHTYLSTNANFKGQELNNDDATYCSICQTIFYMFCSRHLELDAVAIKQIKNMNFQKMISSHLKPLEYCSNSISSKFAELAKHYQLCYCSMNFKSNKTGLPSNHVKSFYPFETYILPVSYEKIKPLLNEYSFHDRENDDEPDSSDVDTDVIMNSYNPSYKMNNLWETFLSDSSPHEVNMDSQHKMNDTFSE